MTPKNFLVQSAEIAARAAVRVARIEAKARVRAAELDAEARKYAARVSAGIVRPREKSAAADVPDEWKDALLAHPEIPDVEREDLYDAYMKLSGRVKATDMERLAATNFYEPRREPYGLPDLDGRNVMNGAER